MFVEEICVAMPLVSVLACLTRPREANRGTEERGGEVSLLSSTSSLCFFCGLAILFFRNLLFKGTSIRLCYFYRVDVFRSLLWGITALLIVLPPSPSSPFFLPPPPTCAKPDIALLLFFWL